MYTTAGYNGIVNNACRFIYVEQGTISFSLLLPYPYSFNINNIFANILVHYFNLIIRVLRCYAEHIT